MVIKLIIAKKFGVRVEEFGIGYPPRIFGKQFGDTLYSINWIPLGAFVRIYGEEGGVDDLKSFSKLAMYKRILIVLGGILAFWIASSFIFSFVFLVGPKVPVGDAQVQGLAAPKVEIISVVKNTPAAAAGLKPGDVIVSLKTTTQEKAIEKISDFQDFVQQNKGVPVAISINRGEQPLTVQATPRVNYPDDQGALGIGLERFAMVIEKAPWYLAPFKGVLYTVETTWQAMVGIYSVLASMFSGNGVPGGSELAGPVGITIFLAKAADFGPGVFLYFIGSLSVFIALFNAFPIPALDGGEFVFLVIEKLRGRPVSAQWEQNLTIICFLLLITMSIFVTIRFDIPRVMDFFN